tara:strand:+ start:293 stop:805 length:513 start_codon:yes stop_codon:yes gene_type:complete
MPRLQYFRMPPTVNHRLYRSDVRFGHQNQETTLQYLDSIFTVMLNKPVQVKEFKKNSSTFDFYIPNENILIELKSRRCTIEAYPTQIVGMNKINKGRKYMNKGYRVFYCFLIMNSFDEEKMDLYIMEDNKLKDYTTRLLGNNSRGDKKSECAVIDNKELTHVTSFTINPI